MHNYLAIFKKRTLLLVCLLVLKGSAFSQTLESLSLIEGNHRLEIEKYLNLIASSEEQEWENLLLY